MANGRTSSPILRRAGGELELRVRATPRADRDAVTGLGETADGPALFVRVRSVPESGRANDAIARAVAAWVGVAPSRVMITAGATSRIKTVRVTGADDALQAELERKLSDLGGTGSPSAS